MNEQTGPGTEPPLAAEAAPPWRLLMDDILDVDAPEAVRQYLDGGYAPDTPEGVSWARGYVTAARALRIRRNGELVARQCEEAAELIESRFGDRLRQGAGQEADRGEGEGATDGHG